MIVCRQMDTKQIIPNIMDPEMRDSGACDLNGADHENIYLKDACTNTPLCGDVFVLKPGTNNNGYACNRDITNNSQGERVITMATQTPEVEIHEPDGVLQDPCHSNGLMIAPHPPLSSMYHGTWPIAKDFPTSQSDGSLDSLVNHDTASIFSFNSSNTNASAPPVSCTQATQPQLGTKVEMVYSLLSMLGTHDKDDMSRTLLAMSSSQDSCVSMRQSGCLPLLIQLLHGSDKDSSLLGNTRGSKAARARASAALHNIVHSHPDDKRGRREARVLRLLEQIRAHCDQLRDSSSDEDDEEKKSRSGSRASDIDHHPGPAIAALMKLSFDEEHRHAICTLGGLQAIGELLQVDHEVHANTTEQYNITMRRYACMALTNLTFGDGTNKALLCSMRGVMDALIAQLHSTNEDLCQVAASVLRNLSWRADLASKKMLREVGAVTTLMRAAMRVQKESTLKSILSALWNLSAHCSENKADICTVEGAVEFLVSTLTYKSPSKTLAIIENGGGVLRNVSSHIAVREDYRKLLRQHGCLQILLKHLRSPSLTIVSNACGTLWNLSARCPEDQRALWEMGAVCMLRNLVHSKHRMISMGSAAALKNLLAAKPATLNIDSDKHMKSNMPTLHARKQRAIEAEIDQNLSETCENMESPRNSPTETRKPDGDNSRYIYSSDGFLLSDLDGRRSLMRAHMFMRTGSGDGAMLFDNRMRSPHRVTRSGSQDSVGSVHSDISHDRARVQHMLAKSSKLLYERQGGVLEKRRDSSLTRFNPEGNSNAIEKLRNPPQHMLESEEENRDETINYSSKYVDHATQNCMDPPKQNPCQGVKMADYAADSANYPAQQRKYMYMVPGQYPHMGYPERQMYNDRMVNSANAKNNTEPLISTYGVYAETDLDNIDQLTDYGKRYAEYTDDPCADRTMNYASTYNDPDPNCADCRLEEARRTNERVEQTVHTVHDDSLKTFCTEGTPLNYLSTATSLTDLTGKHEKGDLKKDVLESCAEDETKNYTLEYPEEMGKKVCKESGPNGTTNNRSGTKSNKKGKRPSHPAPSAIPTFRPPIQCVKDFVSVKPTNEVNPIQVDILEDPCEGSPDQVKTYCEEGTPGSVSRVSSISSLHSSDANDHELQPRPNVLQSIEENECSTEENPKTAIAEKITPGINNMEAGMLPEEEDDSEKPSDNMVVLPETGSPSDREHKTVTFDDNHMVEETPLMFSRCSSLGSLSSFEAHSVHSSVVSEYSRRASEVVSPSELPDSPSETFPPSPTRKRAAEKSSTAEEQDDAEPTDEIKDFTVEAPEGATAVHPIEGLPATKAVIVDPLVEMIPDIGKMDSPVVYNLEGTPPNFSETTSLSALTFSDEDSLAVGKKSHLKPIIKEGKSDKLSEKDDKENSSMSEVSEGEEDILAQCISSAMPSNSSKKIRRSTSDNALKKKSDSWKNENVGNARSKFLAKPSLSTDRTNFGSLKLKSCLRSASVQKDDDELLNSDAVKSYATEGTPLNFSRTTSLSDLSILIHDNTSPKNPGNKDAEESDNSSVCDENDKLLSEIIQSAKPKGKVGRKPNIPMDRTAEGSESQEKFPFQIVSYKEKKYPGASTDSVKTYAVEGTPINFSNATSLSDLTIDSIESPESGLGLKDSKLKTDHQNYTIPNGESPIFPMNCANDSPKHYMMEGTPITFSRNDSLSSLSCDDAEDVSFNNQPGGKSGKTRSALQPIGPRWKISPGSGSKLADSSSELSQQVVGKSQDEVRPGIMDPEGYLSDEVPKEFAVEDTPISFSRNSSLSSLKDKHRGEERPQRKMSAMKAPCQEAGIPDQKSSFKVEGTPLCFSRNSSLSSLSIESVSNDFSVTEEALLEACISSAMPKGDKTKTDKSTSKTPSRLPKLNSPGSVPSPDPAEKEKKSLGVSRNESLMSRSSEDYNLKQHTKASLGSEPPSGRRTLDIVGSNEYSNANNLQNESLRKSTNSCSDFSTNSVVEARQRFGWCRSKSQDSDGFLKHKKDCSNHEIAQASSLSNRPFLDLLETATQDGTSSKDNRLLEEKQRSEEEEVEVISSLPHSIDADSNGSIEKVDSEKSEAADDGHYERQKRKVTKDDSMNASFPEDLVSDETNVSDELDTEELPIVKLRGEELNLTDEDKDRSSFEHEISPEEERALEENASLVVCELITKRELSSSTFDEDSLIENETISLVSNDYTSDTASEVSITWSKNSEDLSEYSGSTISQSDTSSRRARIIKPTVNLAEMQVKQEPEGPKSVRGRRKPLYSRKNTTPPVKVTPTKSDNTKVVRPSSNTRQQSGMTKSNPNSPKKTSAKSSTTSSSDIPVNKVIPRTSNVRRSSGSGARSMSPGGPLRSQNSNKPSTGSKLPVVNSDHPTRDNSTMRGQSSQVERPKPPIKQGTFTKETPTSNGASETDKEDQTKTDVDVDVPTVKMREKKTSSSSPRSSGGSTGGSQRNSDTTPPESWTKALGSFNFIVDTSHEQGYHAPFEQIQMQRNSRDPPPALRQTNANSSKNSVTKTPPAPKSSKSSTSSKSGIGSLKRSTLSTVSKTSNSNLDKSNSNSTGNLKKTNSKASLKKSDSNASLKKSNDSSRPSTPTGKKTPSSLGLARNQSSPGGFQSKRSETSSSVRGTPQSSAVESNKASSAGKKPVTSKIASLWKRSESQDSGSPPEVKPAKPPRQQRSHSTGGGQRSRLIPPRINNNNNNNNKKSATASPISQGLSRTHTYDKLSSFSDNSHIVPGKSGDKSAAESKISSPEGNSKAVPPASKHVENKKEEKDHVITKTNSGTWKTQKSRSEARSLPDADQTCRAQEKLAESKKSTAKVAVTPPGTWKNGIAWDNEQTTPSTNNEEVWVKRKEDEKQNEDENRKLLEESYGDVKEIPEKKAGVIRHINPKMPSQNKTASKETVIDSLPPETNVWKSELISPRSELKRTICSDIRTSPQCSISAAIVSPFNYTPSAKSQNNNTLNNNNNMNSADQNKILQKSVTNGSKRSSIPSPSKHATKTEMLLARRRQNYMTKMEDTGDAGEDETRRSCRVTTV